MLFEICGLRKSYDGRDALNIPSLALPEGKIYGLIGPNGAGKTTLLELLAGLISATSGVIRFKGELINTSSAALPTRRRIAYLAQNPVFFQGSVIENVEYGLKVRGVPRSVRRSHALRSLEEVGLAHLAHRKASTLSAGERQRAAFARAICIAPEAMLLDEPTANVDEESALSLVAMMRQLHCEHNISVIFTSHDLSETLALADEIIALRQGRLAPTPVENLFVGQVEHEGERSFVRVNERMRIEVVTEKKGKAKITINPQAILLSRTPLASSARNTFTGSIRRISEKGHRVQVEVDIGIRLVAEITHLSFQEMGLHEGLVVYVSFKSTSVTVY